MPSRTDFDECCFSQARASATRGSATRVRNDSESESNEQPERGGGDVFGAGSVRITDLVELLIHRADGEHLVDVKGCAGAVDHFGGIAFRAAEAHGLAVDLDRKLAFGRCKQDADASEHLEP